ncbi:MAG: hypothetical protein IT480_04250 [Gammaproteobacteria bacterium]|nr:hypothetical protein [Gammaproteobacteria bacterium]
MKNRAISHAVHLVIAGTLTLWSLGARAELGVDDVIALGPVTAVSANGVDFSVLGRAFHADSPVAFGVGEYVAVHGSLGTDGSVADIWVESMGNYVPGSDAVYQKGVVTEVRPFLAQMSIGGSLLDYTSVLANQPDVAPGLGSAVTVSGLQPVAGGPVLVDGLMASADRVRDSLMKGGGVQSSLMKGGGVQSSLMKGGGVQSSLMKGGGVQSSLMKGGGVQSSLMKGGGVQSSLMKGGGVQSSLMKGGGITKG